MILNFKYKHEKIAITIHSHGLCEATYNGVLYSRARLTVLARDLRDAINAKKRRELAQTRLPTATGLKPDAWV